MIIIYVFLPGINRQRKPRSQPHLHPEANQTPGHPVARQILQTRGGHLQTVRRVRTSTGKAQTERRTLPSGIPGILFRTRRRFERQ